MRKGDVFKTRFLKPADLDGKDVVFTISAVSYEPLKDFRGNDTEKLILSFAETKKELVVNATIFDSIVEATGQDDSDNWPSRQVEAFETTVIVDNETKPCIRLRAPPQGTLDAAAAAPKKPAPKQTAPKKTAPAEKSDKDEKSDMDDEIPF